MKKKCTFLVFAAAFVSLQYAFAQSWNLAGNSNATTSSKLGTTNSVPLNFYTNNAQRATITALGRVGIGIANPINILTVQASGGVPSSNWTNVSTQIFYGFAENANGEFNIGTATNTATQRSLIQGKRARGTVASPAAVQNNDYLASIVGSGYDGSAFQNPCEIDFYADGSPSSGHVPGRISFVTGTNGTDRVERMKIGSTGNITLNTDNLTVQQAAGNVIIGGSTYKVYINAGTATGIWCTSSGGYGIYSKNSDANGYGLYSEGGFRGAYTKGSSEGLYSIGGNYGVYARSTNTSSSNSYGVYGSGHTGVYGIGTFGVYASGDTGVYSKGTSYGVYADGGNGTGVYGMSTKTGVYGDGSSTGYYGTYGYSGNIGAYGFGSTYGAYSVGDPSNPGSYGMFGYGNTYGVYGRGKYGIYAFSTASSGDGVHAQVSGSSNYGVNAYSTNSYGVYGYTGNSSSYAGYFSGNVYTTGTYTSSDAKLKKSIKSVDNAMDIISQLQPKNYEFRNDGNYAKMNLPAGKHFGFIAQDLEKVLPGLVKQSEFNTAKAEPNAITPEPVTPGKDGKPVKPTALQPIKEVKGEIIDFKAVNYTELIPIVVKGMQEQQAVITKQQGQIADQQQQINDLKDLVKQLTGKDLRTGVNSVTLEQNNPNPLDNFTTIRYSIPAGTRDAQLLVTDISGKTIKQVQLTSPTGKVSFDAIGLASGTYTYSIIVDGKLMQAKKMVVAKSMR